jgi:predicted metal-dependent HD superfamily phosphohydrolase
MGNYPWEVPDSQHPLVIRRPWQADPVHLPAPASLPADARERLERAYGDPRRGYHDLLHLAEVLARVDELLPDGTEREAVLLAAWFHDAVYDGGPDDEERSALLALDVLGDTELGREVARLVRVTADHRPADDDLAGQVLCDADLAVLAADDARYAAYTDGVRREYAHVPDADFTAGRAAVLRDLLAKPTLFHTAPARERWERRARDNVAAEITRLER